MLRFVIFFLESTQYIKKTMGKNEVKSKELKSIIVNVARLKSDY